jgi:UDP-GlcNAc:undecaprenyl-phosphate/decaprenyl-phosphate GlcNAc-1-phosphate transferase
MAAGLTYCLTPVVRAVALRIGAVDRPGGRKMHAIVTPTLGGLALFFGFVGGLALSSLLFPRLFVSSEAAGIAIGASLMVGIGIVDDLKGLSAPVKLAGQILAATTMTLGGVQVLFFWLPGFGPFEEGVLSLAPELGIPFTVLLVIVFVNAVNLVDGLDGLAAGLVAIGACAYFVYSYRTGATGLIAEDSPAPLLSALLFGVCVGFLPHNFNPARIFMGDTGSMLLGTLLAGATITGIGRTTQPQAGDQFALLIPVAIPILVLALPFLDTLLAVGRRMRSGVGIMTADKQHLHHRLLEIGHSHRRAVLILYAWSALLAGSVVALSFTGPRRVLPFFLAVVACGIFFLLSPRWRRPVP